MRFIKSIVKKYSREYTRTLKDGKKKKYHTEQVQITIPKEDNIFENNEHVLLIKAKHENDLKNISKKMSELKSAKIELKKSNNELKSTIEKNDSTIYEYKSIIKELKNKIDILEKKFKSKDRQLNKNNTIETSENHENSYGKNSDINNSEEVFDNYANMNIKISSKENNMETIILDENTLFKLKLEQRELKKDKKDLKEKIKLLDSHINDLKHSIETIESSKNNELLRLQEDYEKLSNKYKNKKIALKRVEQSAKYHEEVAKKLKEFILRYY